MSTTLIDKHLLADAKTRSIIEDTFDNLTEHQASLLGVFANDLKVRQYVWYSSVCAIELRNMFAFARDDVFLTYVLKLWTCYVDLPEELKEAFREHWDAIEKKVIHIEINNAIIDFVDLVVARYVETRDSNICFIKGALELFDIIDKYYYPESGGAMSEEERRFIFEKTCDAFRPMLREQRATKLTYRDQVALEVFEMVRDWADDDCFDKFENYPIGPDIAPEEVINDISKVTESGLFGEEEVAAYKQLKMRDIAELIHVNVNFEYYDEAMSLYYYYGQLVQEIGDSIRPSYYDRYNDAGEALKTAIEGHKKRGYAKRKKN